MIELLWLAGTGAATAIGYLKTRQFVRGKLRYVDAVKKPAAPLITGAAAALVAAPVVALLPVVGTISALVFGTGVGVGVAHGAKDTRRLPGM